MTVTRAALFMLSLLGPAALGACKDKAAKAEDGAAPATSKPSAISLPVVGETVRKGDLVLSVTTTGQVRSDAMAHLKAEATGTVQAVLVIPGQHVARGHRTDRPRHCDHRGHRRAWHPRLRALRAPRGRSR